MRNAIIVSFCFLVIVFQPIKMSAQAPTWQDGERYADKLREFEEFVRKQIEKDKIPGLTVGFFKDNYIWVKGFGYADLENNVPAKPESAYRLASITKPFTAVAILQLVEKGKIQLDEDIRHYVPYYAQQKWRVTVRQLLAHTGGGPWGSGLGPEYLTTRQVVDRISQKPLAYEPDTKFLYTTSGYNLLGAAIEEVSGKSMGDYLRENIFLPLKMNDTRMNSERELIPNRVRTYERVNGEIRLAQFVDVSTRFGGGGLIGTIPDLLKAAREFDSDKILTKEFKDIMYTHHSLKNGRYAALNYVLGWWYTSLNGQWLPWHGGAQIGTSTILYRFPSKNMAIAFAANTHDAYPPIVERLYELLTDEPWEIPVYTKDSTAQAFYNALKNVFNHGEAWFDRYQKSMTGDLQDNAEAFNYFNRTVNFNSFQINPQSTNQAINDGLNPVTNSAFFKVGSLMASKLHEKYGKDHDKMYHIGGAIVFFADYINLYQSQSQFPKELKFNESFESLIANWNKDWNRTWNDEIRHLKLNEQSYNDALARKLKTLFTNAEVYPNIINSLLAITGDIASLKSTKLAVTLYPQSARTNWGWGYYLLLVNQYGKDGHEYLLKNIGEAEDALPYFKKSLELEPDGYASSKNFEAEAIKFLKSGKVDETISLLNIGIELHPKAAQLHVRLCEAYSHKGIKEKGVEACKKALRIEPNMTSAQELLKNLQ